MSIPHVMHCYWAGLKISYLRYLSLASFRAQHPDWHIKLYGPAKEAGPWAFKVPGMEYGIHDYRTEAVSVLGVKEMVYTPEDARVMTMPPANQSDIFSYEILVREGGWYMDLDTMWIKPLDRHCDAGYAFVGFGGLCDYVGVFGAVQGSWVMRSFYEPCLENFKHGNYNSTGTYGIEKLTSTADWQEKFKAGDKDLRNWRAPREMFYPLLAQESEKLWTSTWEPGGQTTSVHIYGGNEDYQIANYEADGVKKWALTSESWVARHARSLPTSLSLADKVFPLTLPPHMHIASKEELRTSRSFLKIREDYLVNDKLPPANVQTPPEVLNTIQLRDVVSQETGEGPFYSGSEPTGSRDTITADQVAERPHDHGEPTETTPSDVHEPSVQGDEVA